VYNDLFPGSRTVGTEKLKLAVKACGIVDVVEASSDIKTVEGSLEYIMGDHSTDHPLSLLLDDWIGRSVVGYTFGSLSYVRPIA